MNLAVPNANGKKKPRGKPFQPGNKQGGNPHGGAVANFHAQIMAHANTGTNFSSLVQKLYDQGMAGDSVCMRDYLDRCMGKPTQTIQTEDVTQRQVWTDEMILAGFLRFKIPESEWPDELLAKWRSGRIRVESREVNVQKALPKE